MSNNFGVNGIIFLSLFFLIMKENLNSKEFCKITEFKSFDYSNCSSGNLLFVYINYFSDFSDFKYLDFEEYNLQIPSIHYIKIKKFVINNCLKDGNIKLKQITNLNKNGPKKYKTQFILSCLKR